MKFVLCLSCKNAFNLTKEFKSCPCGETKGKKEGKAITVVGKGKPFSLNADEFWMGLKRQQREDDVDTEPCTCMGNEFKGQWYPEKNVNLKNKSHG